MQSTLDNLLKKIDKLENSLIIVKRLIEQVANQYDMCETYVIDPLVSDDNFNRIYYQCNEIGQDIITIHGITRGILEWAVYERFIRDASICSDILKLLEESFDCLLQLKSTFDLLYKELKVAYNEYLLSDESGNLANVVGMYYFQKLFCKAYAEEFVILEKFMFLFGEFKDRINALNKSGIFIRGVECLDF